MRAPPPPSPPFALGLLLPLLVLAAAALAPSTARGAPPGPGPRKVAVSAFRVEGGLPADIGYSISDMIAVEVAKFEGVDVVSWSDLRALVDREAQNQLLGCERPECAVDLPA